MGQNYYVPLRQIRDTDDSEEAAVGETVREKTFPVVAGRTPVHAVLVSEQAHAEREGIDKIKVRGCVLVDVFIDFG